MEEVSQISHPKAASGERQNSLIDNPLSKGCFAQWLGIWGAQSGERACRSSASAMRTSSLPIGG